MKLMNDRLLVERNSDGLSKDSKLKFGPESLGGKVVPPGDLDWDTTKRERLASLQFTAGCSRREIPFYGTVVSSVQLAAMAD